VDNGGNDGTGCFRIKVRTDTAELTNMRIAGVYNQCVQVRTGYHIAVRFVLCKIQHNKKAVLSQR